MKSPKIKKSIIVILSLSVLAIGFLVFWPKDHKFTPRVTAGENDVRLRGWVWTDTIGWISLNCRTDGSCNSHPYEVYIDKDDGNLGGFAWSEHVGWIAFEKVGFCLNSSTGQYDYRLPCSGNGDCASNDCSFASATPPDENFKTSKCTSCTGNCTGCYNVSDKQFYGWAKVLADSSTSADYDAGWIKLDDTRYSLTATDDSSLAGPVKGGYPWGDLRGWAWNGSPGISPNNADKDKWGLGWLSFNCADRGGCATSDYKVTGRPEDMGAVAVVRRDGKDSSDLDLDWSPVYGAHFYEVWRQNSTCKYKNVETGYECNPRRCNSAICINSKCYLNTKPNLYPLNEACVDNKCTHLLNGDFSCDLHDYGSVAGDAPDYFSDAGKSLFVNYSYIIRACNKVGADIFACSKASAASKEISPIDLIVNLQATSICLLEGTPNASVVDLAWSRPNIQDVELNKIAYDIDFCQLEPNQNAEDCADSDWQQPAADCADPIDNPADSAQSCRETLADGNSRFKSTNLFVYRIRASGKTCVGGANNFNGCDSDADCSGGDTCTEYKGSWAFSNVFRICPPNSAYEERRPE